MALPRAGAQPAGGTRFLIDCHSPVNLGRLPAGKKYSDELASTLQVEPDTLQRQLVILDWFFPRYLDYLPGENILRHEHVVASSGARLFEAVGVPNAPTDRLSSQNQNQLYAGLNLQALYDGLREYSGCWESIYSEADFQEILSAMT